MRVCAVAASAALAVSPSFASAAQTAAKTTSPRPASVVSSGSCSFKYTEVAAAASFDHTTSTNFVSLGDAGSIAFTQNRTGCVGGVFFANSGN